MSTLIKGGTVVTAGDTYAADVLIDGETIVAIGQRRWRATRRSTPAASMSSPAGSTCIRTWTCRSAARSPPTTSSPATRPRRSAARPCISTSPSSRRAPRCARRSTSGRPRPTGKAAIDYGFHIAITDLPDSVMDEIKRCPEYGVTSLKLFMAYKGALHGGRRDALPRDAAGRRARAADHGPCRERRCDRHPGAPRRSPPATWRRSTTR